MHKVLNCSFFLFGCHLRNSSNSSSSFSCLIFCFLVMCLLHVRLPFWSCFLSLLGVELFVLHIYSQ